MDYNLDSLDERNFEHVVQALALQVVGEDLTIFGDGPDGGREASWTTSAASIGSVTLDAYGVLQAKHRLNPDASPSANYRWLVGHIEEDVRRWKKAEHKRRAPSIYIVATNVKIGSGAGAGKDKAPQAIQRLFERSELNAPTVIVWDRDDLRARLDNNADVRGQYAAWITPSTVLSAIIDQAHEDEKDLLDAIQLHAANSIKRDRNLKLSQTGTVRDETMSIADVFIDLPCDSEYAERKNRFHEANPMMAAAHAISAFDTIQDQKQGSEYTQLVLVGGPGQGKSTVTQFLGQYYRALFLENTTAHLDTATRTHIDDVRRRAQTIGLKKPTARRWPIRINLPNLADALADKSTDSMLSYIAAEVSERSGIDLSSQLFRRWLKRIPWAVILDGLDEVPSSANRAQLFEAISTFTALARTSQADVVIVGTTRPQGYSGEFGSARHINLSPLPAATALDYADNFLLVRNGPDYPENDRTRKLLRETITDDASVRLFESPLQVTILSVLLEKLGHAPSNKWSLFSSYYTVILQREQEKPGELARLLQEFGPHITYVHRKVGNLLQERGEQAGTSDSTLSNGEFRQLIVQRLVELGHDEFADSLADQILSLATDRLVFLAMLTPETVGFELRSFQEFMAGEQIVADRSEAETLQRLKDIAGDSYWRNTFLFAAGHIFQNRDVLKASLLQITQELDVMGAAHEEAGRGRELALDLLAEDFCVSEPMMSKPLAKHAAHIVRATNSHRSSALASLRDSWARQTVELQLQSNPPKDIFDMIGEARFIAGQPHQAAETKQDAILHLFESSSSDLKPLLLHWFWSEPNESWDKVIATSWDLLDPIALSEPSPIVPDPGQQASLTPWHALQILTHSRGTAPKATGFGKGPEQGRLLTASITLIDSNREAWAALATVAARSDSWILLSAIGTFVSAPSALSLAAVARAAISVHVPALQRSQLSLPWLVHWLIDTLDSLGESELEAFVKDLEGGQFGDADDWLAAEADFDINPLRLEQILERTSPATTPQILSTVPLEGYEFSASIGSSPSSLESQVATALELLANDDFDLNPHQRAELSHLATFIISMAADAVRRQRPVPEVSAVRESIKNALVAEAGKLTSTDALALANGGIYPAWLSWLSLFTGPEVCQLFGVDFLDHLGRANYYVVNNDDKLASSLLAWARLSTPSAGLLAAIVILDPGLFEEVTDLPAVGDWPEPLASLMTALSSSNTAGGLSNAPLDTAIARLTLPRNLRLTSRILRGIGTEQAGYVAALISRELRSQNDLAAFDFAQIARSSLDPGLRTSFTGNWRFI